MHIGHVTLGEWGLELSTASSGYLRGSPSSQEAETCVLPPVLTRAGWGHLW